ncbi:riboflavin biosynthesis protein RibD C-terminal domain protein [Leptospira fainei serovar Hurstbridge str. BUT 6]|uniref:Riboflavin biosynthesis protein RibD C-terminal domain protein n=1 Tax=Leptospira fainei serovar Hurstbridge str. BUT 6 TaxID=1193011 RepID=S3VX88_9LEPT|nr:dihydrofolate reductase family protein [Leptospira fainei]EPG72757.1 riboflavin biosynthesis protein RibD C-terminal domain protein [Leptospira fainei serovar Hurstbridge str. BUT 6]
MNLHKTRSCDEFRNIVSPILLGKGRTLFGEMDSKLNLKLVRTTMFDLGLVSLCYKPD